MSARASSSNTRGAKAETPRGQSQPGLHEETLYPRKKEKIERGSSAEPGAPSRSHPMVSYHQDDKRARWEANKRKVINEPSLQETSEHRLAGTLNTNT